jgi:hypothetical protein
MKIYQRYKKTNETAPFYKNSKKQHSLVANQNHLTILTILVPFTLSLIPPLIVTLSLLLVLFKADDDTLMAPSSSPDSTTLV